MNKRLLTLGVVGLLAGTPKVYAEIDSLKMGTKKDLVEVVSTDKQEEGKLTATFFIEEVKKASEEKEVLEKVLDNDEVQAVIETYGKENIERIIREVVNSQETDEIVKEAMENKDIQKALKEGNQERFEELIRKIVYNHHKDPLWVLIVNAVITISVREFWKYIIRKRSK